MSTSSFNVQRHLEAQYAAPQSAGRRQSCAARSPNRLSTARTKSVDSSMTDQKERRSYLASPMSFDLETALLEVVRRIGVMVVSVPYMRASLRPLARRFLVLTELETGVEQSLGATAATVTVPARKASEEIPVPARPRPTHEALPTVPGVEVPIGWVERVQVANDDVELIEARCHLKAEVTLWVIERQGLINSGGDPSPIVEPTQTDIIARANGLNCFLWMIYPSALILHDRALAAVLAQCFENVAMAVSVVRQLR